MSWAAVFDRSPGTPARCPVESPGQRLHVATLSGVTPNFSITASGPSLVFLIGSIISSARPDELHQSLSEGHDGAGGTSFDGRRVGRDQVVGLVAVELAHPYVATPWRFADARNCGIRSSGGSGRLALYLSSFCCGRYAAGVEIIGDMVDLGCPESATSMRRSRTSALIGVPSGSGSWAAARDRPGQIARPSHVEVADRLVVAVLAVLALLAGRRAGRFLVSPCFKP